MEVDPDIRKEFENQKKYLHNSMTSLEKRLEMERSIHKEDNLRIMYMNIELIHHIIDLRKAVKQKESLYKRKDNDLKEVKSKYSDAADSPHLRGPVSNDSI